MSVPASPPETPGPPPRSMTRLYPARNPGGRPFTAEDLWRTARVGRPAPVPRGDAVVAAVTTYDLEKNEGRGRLWWVPDGDGEPRPLTARETSSNEPAASPDGKWIAFTRKRNAGEKAQVHLLPVDGGEAEKLTDLPLGAADPRWFPDGRRVAFVAPLLLGALTPEATKRLTEEREKDPVKAYVTEDRVYRCWDRWLARGEVPHIFVLDLGTRQLTDLTPEAERWFDFMDSSGQYDIAPDGREIAFAATASEPPHAQLRWGIFTVPTAGGPARCLTPRNPADDFWPRYSPDGRWLVYGKQLDPSFYADRVRLVRVDRATGEEKELCPAWDRSPVHWEFADPATLVFEAEDRGRVKLYRVGIEGGEPRELVGRGTVAGLAPAGNGRLYFAHQDLSSPAEIAACDLGGGGLRALTRFNRAFHEEVALGEARELEFEGAEGRPVQAFVLLPPGFDPSRRWPLVHVIHGGPHGISGDQFHPRWNAHLFAAPGYVVCLVNFHGSTSWGQEFAQCIQGAHGDRPFRDMMRATDALLATGHVDGSRMAAAGGSYGGYLVSWIAGHTDRFRCLVNHAGVYDTLAQYASDLTHGRDKAYGGEPWAGLENIDRWNPARSASGFVTPMLVTHGERDLRVPVSQGLEAYGVLKAKGVPARLVYFPDEHHWVLKPRNAIFWYREVHDWLKRFLS